MTAVGKQKLTCSCREDGVKPLTKPQLVVEKNLQKFGYCLSIMHKFPDVFGGVSYYQSMYFHFKT